MARKFYPPGLPQRDELRYVAERMNSVEINGSFYSLQRRSTLRPGSRWCRMTSSLLSRAGGSLRT